MCKYLLNLQEIEKHHLNVVGVKLNICSVNGDGVMCLHCRMSMSGIGLNKLMYLLTFNRHLVTLVLLILARRTRRICLPRETCCHRQQVQHRRHNLTLTHWH